MAISFVGKAEISAVNGGAMTLTLPGSMAVDDLILVAHGNGDDSDNAMPTPTTAGYSSIAELYGNGTQDANLRGWYKYHNGSDTQCVLAAVGGTNAGNSSELFVFRGVALAVDGGPFDVASTTAVGTTGGNPDPPSIDWATAGTWIVIMGCAGHILGAAATFTNPTGYTTNGDSISGNDTFDSTTGVGYKEAPADPENPGVMTLSGAGTGWAAITMALKPAVVAPVLGATRLMVLFGPAMRRASRW